MPPTTPESAVSTGDHGQLAAPTSRQLGAELIRILQTGDGQQTPARDPVQAAKNNLTTGLAKAADFQGTPPTVDGNKVSVATAFGTAEYEFDGDRMTRMSVPQRNGKPLTLTREGEEWFDENHQKRADHITPRLAPDGTLSWDDVDFGGREINRFHPNGVTEHIRDTSGVIDSAEVTLPNGAILKMDRKGDGTVKYGTHENTHPGSSYIKLAVADVNTSLQLPDFTQTMEQRRAAELNEVARRILPNGMTARDVAPNFAEEAAVDDPLAGAEAAGKGEQRQTLEAQTKLALERVNRMDYEEIALKARNPEEFRRELGIELPRERQEREKLFEKFKGSKLMSAGLAADWIASIFGL